MEKKYWQNFGELNQSDAYTQSAGQEFKEELLPLEDMADEGLLEGKTARRDFLKYLGFSTAAAALAASCEMPVRKAVPYLQKPDNVIPGVSNYYASTYVNGGDAISVVVKQREGRPIKIEGNELSTITKGGTSARSQASVLDLYDTTRLRHPLQKDGTSYKEVSTFDAFDNMVSGAIANLGGRSIVLLTSTINSPSTLQIINDFLAKYPGSRHVQYDAISYSGMLMANEACYGKRALPSYHFDKAQTIVSLSADFLGTWISPVEFSHQYAKNRKINGENPSLSRHIHFESMLSLTGSNADDRFTHKPSETGLIALALLAKLGGSVPAPSINDAKLAKGIELAAAQLTASKGSALVVCGSNDVNVQVVVNAINELIGANGATINWAVTSNYRKGIDADMAKLVADMSAGTVGGLLVYDCNPAYSYYDSKKFTDALSKLPLSVSFNATMDETTEACKYILPSHHWLESWGDAEPKSGFISLLQPVISPLFKTRAFQTSLIKWIGGQATAVTAVAPNDSTAKVTLSAPVNNSADAYENYIKSYWSGKLGSLELWDKALQDGVIETETLAAAGTYSAATLGEAAGKIAAVKAGAMEVVLYEKISMGNGNQANNPWLQELPDPISKVTWDNYAMMSPDMAKTIIGLDVMNNQRQADSYEVTPEKPVVKITVNGRSVELPVLILPGLNSATVAVALGYGRQSANKDQTMDRIGRAATGAGKNAYPMAIFDGTSVLYSAPATIEKTSEAYPLAQTQVHGSSESRPILFETTLANFRKNPEAVLEEPRHERKILMADGKTDFRKDATMYPDFVKPGIKWGMSIDLNTCTGCSACVVACTAENNVSVVGKIQVQRAHEMHWLRIDRYFTGDVKNPDVVFQPMLCQHCDNAPCENVCPVAATNHSSEGLNQMTYNRCIGTRYCANNCPYKVRRFNWLDFTGSDSFADNQEPLRGKDLDEVVFQMNEDLTRMVLNPDVTVRARGVIEKCSFCVQRLQDSKLESKKQQDPTIVRNVKTACMQACPTNAIHFGNVNDKESEVSKARKDDNRTFYVLEQLHVLPNVSYLAKIRNTDRHIGPVEEEHGEKPATKKEEKAHA
ncbi:MAG TPA: TAT-variant-translocated molybdopterin oxidoreductase [Ferruginibacter sp.]|nr:TAT-variant-translocated molybdopterin oxidoreductase [Ferruginibacter sp.]